MTCLLPYEYSSNRIKFGRMQNSNIDLSDKQLSEDDNIKVLASSASSSELNTGLEVSQNEKLGYTEVLAPKAK